MITVLVFFTSCASYRTSAIRNQNQPLHNTSLHSIEGSYSLKPLHHYGKRGTTDSLNIPEYEILSNYLRMQATTTDTLSDYTIDIKVESKTSIQCYLKKGIALIDSVKIRGKVKKNGLFHFKDNPVNCYGIPYILGGCSFNKARIGLTENGDLLLQYASYSGGALLIIIGDGRSYNKTYSFSRISQKQDEHEI
jgi:hypothetical protein